MLNKVVLSLAGFVLGTTFWSSIVHAEPLIELAPPFRAALSTAKRLLADIKYIDYAVTEIRADRSPRARSTTWRGIVADAENFGKEIRQYDFLSRFDASRYSVSFPEYMACHTRSGAQQVSENYIAELRAGVAAASEIAAAFFTAEGELNEASRSARELARISAQFASIPRIRLHFLAWEWFDLETKVAPALAAAACVIKSRRERLLRERQLIETKLSNLSGNLRDLSQSECSIAGDWKGMAPQEGSVVREWRVSLSKTINGYQCRLHFVNAAYDCCNVAVSIPNRTVNFQRDCGSQYSWIFEYRLNQGYTEMTGEARLPRLNQTYANTLTFAPVPTRATRQRPRR